MLTKLYTSRELERKRRRVKSKGPLLHAPPTSLAPLSIDKFFTQFFQDFIVVKEDESPEHPKSKPLYSYRPAVPQDEWDAIRSAVMIRDSLICTSCDDWAELGVHHIDHNKTNNDPDNLETLCWPCHSAHHHEHGYS